MSTIFFQPQQPRIERVDVHQQPRRSRARHPPRRDPGNVFRVGVTGVTVRRSAATAERDPVVVAHQPATGQRRRRPHRLVEDCP